MGFNRNSKTFADFGVLPVRVFGQFTGKLMNLAKQFRFFLRQRR